MAVRMVEVASADGSYHKLHASQCRDSSRLSVPDNGSHWWGARNDCNGFFSIHWGIEEALVEAAQYNDGAEVYVVPVVVFVDADHLRIAGARERAKGMGMHLSI